MPLEEGQWQVRDLVLGPDTEYRLMDESNPFTMTVRADQGGPRAWNHGSWSGAEWANERIVPMRILIDTWPDDDAAAWLAAHQTLAAAFAPVGDAVADVELRFVLGGTEYLLHGRPRMVEPDVSLSQTGRGFTRAAFVAPDPRIYSGTLSEVTTGLPTQSGGLTVPFTVPFTVSGVLTNGRADLVNAGTTDTSLLIRIDGPAPDPWVALQRPDGSTQQIRMDLTLTDGQWLDIDTAAGTALLNGLPTASQRHKAAWDMDAYPLPPGTTLLRFDASDYNVDAEVTVSFRSAWW